MITIVDKALCCGCTACKNICPKNCIDMKPDYEGFLYPIVDEDRCIGCNECKKVCPVFNAVDEENKVLEAYVLRTKNREDLLESTSGGITTPLAEWVFQQKGKFWAATYDENWDVCHMRHEENDCDFKKTRGSKYVQSFLGETFSEIKRELLEGDIVCFVGTTCQVYGLKKFLKKDFDNLITVDLVCHGTPSPALWRKYIDYQQKKYKSKIIKINFRNKTYGYHSGTMMIQFKNEKKYTGSARVDYMLKSFFSEIASRPSCYQCAFKKLNRISDFTIFDCWHMSELVPNIKDDDQGYTNLLVHSEKGRKILENLKENCIIYSSDINKAVALDGIMIQESAIPNERRSEFYKDIHKYDMEEYIKQHIKITALDHVLEASKKFAYKLGVMNILRKLKR